MPGCYAYTCQVCGVHLFNSDNPSLDMSVRYCDLHNPKNNDLNTNEETTSHAETGAAPNWAVVELMGRTRIGGQISEAKFGGATMIRLDVPQGDGFATQLIGGAAVYRITYCDEITARAACSEAASNPIQRWELERELNRAGLSLSPVDQQALPAPCPFDEDEESNL